LLSQAKFRDLVIQRHNALRSRVMNGKEGRVDDEIRFTKIEQIVELEK
jgi:hypothetical protein